MPRKKSTDHRLNKIAAVAAPTAPPMWVETPGWVLGPDSPSILLPYHEESGRLDQAALTAVTKKVYLGVVANSVAAGEFPKWCDPESSWLRLLLYRDYAEHGGYCSCPPCTAKKPPAPPPQPAAPAGERYRNEPGLDRRHPRNAERERTLDRDEGTSEWPAAK